MARVLIDAEDAVVAISRAWYLLRPRERQGPYVVAAGSKSFLHRLLLNPPTGIVVDHINHDTLDNRRSNLRMVSNMANMQNRVGPNRNSKSGVLGVTWDAARGTWAAWVHHEGRTRFLGRFATVDEAAQAVRNARARLLPWSQEALQADNATVDLDPRPAFAPDWSPL